MHESIFSGISSQCYADVRYQKCETYFFHYDKKMIKKITFNHI